VIRLYHRERAGRPARARWALEEAGADYEFVVMGADEAAGEQHGRRHPLGRVPVLETEAGVLFESAAICLQIADLFPEAGLIPAIGTHDRGLVYQWTVFAMSELEPAVIGVYRAEQAGDEAAGAAGRERTTTVLAALDARLAAREYLVGDRLTVADIVVGGVLLVAQRLALLPEASVTAQYLERLDARPAKQRAYA
jgi:glutathione S-transferase